MINQDKRPVLLSTNNRFGFYCVATPIVTSQRIFKFKGPKTPFGISDFDCCCVYTVN